MDLFISPGLSNGLLALPEIYDAELYLWDNHYTDEIRHPLALAIAWI